MQDAWTFLSLTTAAGHRGPLGELRVGLNGPDASLPELSTCMCACGTHKQMDTNTTSADGRSQHRVVSIPLERNVTITLSDGVKTCSLSTGMSAPG